MSRNIQDLRFDALRNAMYHTARRMTLDRYNRWCSFFVIALGAAAIGDAFKVYEIDIQRGWFGAAVALVGAAQLVFDFGGRARDHQSLQKEYYNILADVEGCVEPTQEQVAIWYSRMTRIMGDEPPTLRAVDAKAYNDALDSQGRNPAGRLVIPFHQRIFGNYFTFEGAPYRSAAELEELKKIAA